MDVSDFKNYLNTLFDKLFKENKQAFLNINFLDYNDHQTTDEF